MRDFQFLSFCTEYEMKRDGRVLINMAKNACFRRAYEWLSRQDKKISAEYTIIIHKGCSWGKRNKYKNACVLERKELRYHLNQLKDAVPFLYRIKEVNNKRDSYFELHVKVTEGTIIQHKYLLAWIRYTYEYPYNVMLLEARKLRWEKGFRFESGFNLFNIVGQCFDLWPGGHSVAYDNNVELLRKEALKRRLQNTSSQARLNNIFNHSHVSHIAMIPRTSKINKKLSITDLEYWTNDQLFAEERLPVYKERLKYLQKK